MKNIMKLVGRIKNKIVLVAWAKSRFERPKVTSFSPDDLPGLDASEPRVLGVLALWARHAAPSLELEWIGDYSDNPD
jgi:hypothetical protein